MSENLFVRLSKYRPTAGKSAIENFFTELVGHLLAREDVARRAFLAFLPSNLADGLRDAKVTTQYSTESRNIDLAQLRPDLAALSIQWSPTRVLRFSESGHTERNTYPFRIEGVKAAARKQEVGIPEKIMVGRSNVGAEEGTR